MFVILKPFHERHAARAVRPTRSPRTLRQRLHREVEEAQVAVFGAPPVDGLGNAGGFKLMVEDRGNVGLDDAARPGRQPGRARPTSSPAWSACSTASAPTRRSSTSTSTAPSARRWAWRLSDVFNTLQVYLGGYYVNNFNHFGRTWQVNVQADAPFRTDGRRRQAAPGPQRPRARWCRWARVADVRDVDRPGHGHALQHVPRRGHQRRARCPASAPGRSSQTMETLADDELPPTRWPSSGPS